MIKTEIKTEWDLEKHYFKSLDDERIQQHIDSDVEQIDNFIESYKGKISSLNDVDFLSFLEKSSSLMKKITKVYYYYSYLNTLNTQDQEVLKKIGEISNLWSELSQKLLFISEEYKEVGYDKFIERSEMDMFAHIKNELINDANSLKYILPSAQEKNLIETNKVTSIFNDMYTELTNSFEFEIDGEKKTKSEIYSLRLSADASVREKANDAMLNKYGDNKIVLGGLYKSVCKNMVSKIKIRGYEGVMHTRNISEEMDKDVVDALLDNVKSNYSIFHKHMENKARLMGKEKLEFHDVLAPISNDVNQEFTFEEGYDFYMNIIEKFDSYFHSYSRDIFEDGRVSVFPNQGKMGGAYASYGKDKDSFVMLNHTNDFQSIMTLAHELGHAIHGGLSQVQPESVYHSPLSLAETASIFNETFVFEEILKTVSEEERTFYIMKHLDDVFATMFRQVMYVDFERECHNRFLNGEELSYDDFNDIWLTKSKEFYGEHVNLSDNVKYGWSVIPHIFKTPFYCYAYSFGNILSFNLYDIYKNSDDKEGFIEMYKGILKSGGSKRPKDLLSENNIDITSKDFYNQAFNVIRNFVESV